MTQIYIGRQPMLDREGTISYELLFRATQQSTAATVIDGDIATSTVLSNAISEIGLDELVGDRGRQPHRTVFKQSRAAVVSHRQIRVVAGAETVNFTEVVPGRRNLIDNGYTVALDDFEYCEAAKPLLDMVRVVKYDYTVTGPDALRTLAQQDRDAGRKVTVERIETQQKFDLINDMAVDYFQGYFAKPVTLNKTGIPSSKITLFELLSKVNSLTRHSKRSRNWSPETSVYRQVLRYVNSAGRRGTTSVPVRQYKPQFCWDCKKAPTQLVNIMLMANISEKPIELINLALYREVFCETLAEDWATQTRSRVSPQVCSPCWML